MKHILQLAYYINRFPKFRIAFFLLLLLYFFTSFSFIKSIVKRQILFSVSWAYLSSCAHSTSLLLLCFIFLSSSAMCFACLTSSIICLFVSPLLHNLVLFSWLLATYIFTPMQNKSLLLIGFTIATFKYIFMRIYASMYVFYHSALFLHFLSMGKEPFSSGKVPSLELQQH